MNRNDALDQIDYLKTIINKNRVTAEQGYPYCILWGAIWIIGYLSNIWFSPIVWFFLTIPGGILSVVIGIKWPWPPSSDIKLLKKVGIQAAVLFAFLIIYPNIIYDHPTLVLDGNIFYPVILGIIYMMMGIMIGKSFTILGALLVLTGTLSKFFEGSAQNVWLALACGGTLFISGFLFRKAVIQREKRQ